MIDLLDFITLESAASWAWLLCTFAAILIIPRLFGLRFLCGVLIAQVTFAINAIPIITGLATDSISNWRAFHFYVIEFGFLTIVFWAYRRVLARRREVLAALDRFFDGKGAVILCGFMALMCVFNLIVVPLDGSSRIEYMGYGWYSYLKPFIQLSMPLAYVGLFIILRSPGRRFLLIALLLLTIAANIFSGSKASFMIGLGTAFLIVRDLEGAETRVRKVDKWVLSMVSVILALFALYRLEVTPSSMGDRLLLTGDSTILVYFSDDPTAAGREVSMFAKMHRGLARALGDASANDIDTVFGFAINRLQTGKNTFTGPNARLSAYFLCNFPEELIICGLLMICIYFALLLSLFKNSLPIPTLLAVVFPYVVTSLGVASQDFNLIMADITLSAILLTGLFCRSCIRRQAGPIPAERRSPEPSSLPVVPILPGKQETGS